MANTPSANAANRTGGTGGNSTECDGVETERPKSASPARALSLLMPSASAQHVTESHDGTRQLSVCGPATQRRQTQELTTHHILRAFNALSERLADGEPADVTWGTCAGVACPALFNVGRGGSSDDERLFKARNQAVAAFTSMSATRRNH
jgi:hypothetical protein